MNLVSAMNAVPDPVSPEPAEVALTAQKERLGRILETQRTIAAGDLGLRSAMEVVCDRTCELTGADGSAVLLHEGEALVQRAATGFMSDARDFPLAIESTFPGWVHRNDRPGIATDVLTDPRVSSFARERGIRSAVAVPLRHRDHTVGQLLALSRRPSTFDEEDVKTLELLSVVLSAAMSHASELETLATSRVMFERAPIGIVRVAADGHTVEANPAMEQMLGYTAAELAAISFSEYTHPDDVVGNLELFQAMMAGECDMYQLEKRCFRKDGELIWTQVTAALQRGENGSPLYAVSMIENITERKKAEEELRRQADLNEYQALHDALTGLPNRTLFHDRIEQAILAATRAGEAVAVLMLDLDRFKEVNDSLGHHAGDALLKQLARRIGGALRASDTVARLGGDEFGILLPGQCDPPEVIGVVERVREALAQPVVVRNLPLTVEGSVGIALFPADGKDVDTLIQRADVAMYVAKEERSAYSFYDASADKSDPARLTLVSELRRAIEARELVLHYQPKVAVPSGEVVAVEALVRWQHPRRGLIPPLEFIPLVQETSLIRPLTRYVIDEALRQCRSWHDEGLPLSMAVNVSAQDLLDAEFPDEVERLLEKWEVAPSSLELEITESTMLADPVRTSLILERLASMGVRLAVDDFGTGHSSLAYLKRLPVDEIKIDRSFVQNMDAKEDDAIIVRSTIDLGRNLGLEVVAEGVETQAAWEQLGALGCTTAQGYFLSRPLPAAEAGEWLRAHGDRRPRGERSARSVR